MMTPQLPSSSSNNQSSPLQQQLSIVPKMPSRTIPVLPHTATNTSSTSTSTNIRIGGQLQEPQDKKQDQGGDKSIKAQTNRSDQSSMIDRSIDLSTLTPTTTSTSKNGEAINNNTSTGKKGKGANNNIGTTPKGKGKSKKALPQAAAMAAASTSTSTSIIISDMESKCAKTQLIDVCNMDEDPGPLRVFTMENREQTANEIHEMFVRALAEQNDRSAPPQVRVLFFIISLLCEYILS